MKPSFFNDISIIKSPFEFVLLKASLIFFIMLLIGFISKAQYNIDSVELRLAASKGKEKVSLLLKLSEVFIDSIPERSHEFLNKIPEAVENINDSVFLGDLYKRIGKIQKHQLRYRLAVRSYQKALLFAHKRKDSIAISEIHNTIANLNIRSGDYSRALENLHEALRISSLIHSEWQESICLSNIALVNFILKNYEKTRSYLNKALLFANKSQNVDALYLVNKHFALLYDDLGDLEKSLDYNFKALEIAKSHNDTKYTSYILNNIGLSYLNAGKYQNAYDYYLRALEIDEKFNDVWGIAVAHLNLATALSNMKEYDKALLHIGNAKEISERMKLKPVSRFVYEVYHDLYSKMGKYKLALSNYKLSVAYRDSMFSEAKTTEISELQANYENEKQKREYELLVIKQKHQQFVKRMLITGIIVLLLIFGIVVRTIILRREKDKVIDRQTKLLLREKIELKEASSREMKNELEYKTKQLTTHALNIMQKNKMLASMVSQINEMLEQATADAKPGLNLIKMQLKQNLRTKNDWDLFKMYFEQVNSRFFESMLNINPGLTTNDLHHCALIKLNMNLKESASVLNLSHHSIKSARYRLKKKLGIEPDGSLIDFIREVN